MQLQVHNKTAIKGGRGVVGQFHLNILKNILDFLLKVIKNSYNFEFLKIKFMFFLIVTFFFKFKDIFKFTNVLVFANFFE